MYQQQPWFHLVLVGPPVHLHLNSSQPASPSLSADAGAGRRPMLPKTNLEASSCPPNRRSQRYYEPLSPQAATLSVFPLSPDLPPQRNTGTRVRSMKDNPCAKGTRRRGVRSIH